MLRKSKVSNGFTIVELLIVIVVIAILAAITIVAFNGVQQRAKYARALVSLEQWDKIVKLYYTQNGSLPVATGNGVCLGGGYIANSDFPSGSCMYNGASLADASSTITDDFKVISPAIPADTADIVGKVQGKFNESFRGIIYASSTNSGILSASLVMAMQGDQSCGSANKTTYGPPSYTTVVTVCSDIIF